MYVLSVCTRKCVVYMYVRVVSVCTRACVIHVQAVLSGVIEMQNQRHTRMLER
jgi:hypothetical protein